MSRPSKALGTKSQRTPIEPQCGSAISLFLSLSSSHSRSGQRRGGGRHLPSTPARGGIGLARSVSPPHRPIIGHRLISPPEEALWAPYTTTLLLLLFLPLCSVSNWLPCEWWGGRQSIKLPWDPPTYLRSTHLVTSSIGPYPRAPWKRHNLLRFRIVVR